MNKRYGLIPALDCETLDQAVSLVRSLGNHPFLRGYKVGFSLGLGYGLPTVVQALRPHTRAPLIYDHQKAGTDIPATGPLFARTLARAGIDAAILFPQAGPRTQREWIRALQDEGVEPIGGGAMTHPAYCVSEGGYLADEAMAQMYVTAREEGVGAFVLPLTKPELARAIVRQAGIGDDCTIMSPGFGAQGGAPEAFDFAGRHYLIVGRSLLNSDAPLDFVNELHHRLGEA